MVDGAVWDEAVGTSGPHIQEEIELERNYENDHKRILVTFISFLTRGRVLRTLLSSLVEPSTISQMGISPEYNNYFWGHRFLCTFGYMSTKDSLYIYI